MPLHGKGMLIVFNEVKARDERDFNEWYNREHIDERVNLPGFRRARRYTAVRGSPKYLATYECDTVSDLATPGYLALLANQTAAAQTSGIQLQQLTRTTLQFIPYRGAGPALTDLLSGNVDLMVSQAAAVLPQVRAGSLKAIANLSPRRSQVIPEIPTADEAGVTGLYTSGWFGFFAPKGTPRDIIAKLNGAMVEALADPAVKARFTDLGLDVASREQQTPEGLAAFQKVEIDKWWPIIKEAGVTAQ